jgi:photosystem II PsbZ protein
LKLCFAVVLLLFLRKLRFAVLSSCFFETTAKELETTGYEVKKIQKKSLKNTIKVSETSETNARTLRKHSLFFYSQQNCKIRKTKYFGEIMNFLFQITLFALIGVSFLLVVGVPVVFASPDGWTGNKRTVFSGLGLWAVLVFALGVLNSFVI